MLNKELRIGNLLQDRKGQICEVEEIYKGSFRAYSNTGISHLPFSPIPLTEEWLVEFGFEKDCSLLDPPDTINGNFWCEWIKNDVIIGMPYFDFGFNEGAKSIEIKHVHQLQNLYHALTGEELTLKSLS